jgi:LuxR family maltose regulon positive regulatory protein
MSLDGEVSADAVAALAGDLEVLDGARVLVIDDFHLASAASADALRWLVEYHPPSLQLVVASRVDPPLRVHRMRAHQDLVELRDGDLSFSVEETRSFLSGFGVRLDEPDLALVHRRSEGWVAGLQMAAISIHGSPDPATAAGRLQLHRHTVADYFLEEVLSRRRRSSISCWPPRSLTSFRCPPAPRCGARGRRRCWSSSMARICSWRSWMRRPAPTAITI